MPNNPQKQLPLIKVWKARVLRLTIFPPPPINFRHIDWWSEVMDTPPETIESPPNLPQAVKKGGFRNGTMILIMDPIRIDWRWMRDDFLLEDEEFPNLGDFLGTVDIFIDVMKKLFQSNYISDTKRLAFGAILTQTTENSNEAYKILSNYLPFEVDADTASDFLYQINRSRSSKVIDGLQINRLTKWAGLKGIRNFSIGDQPSILYELPELYAAQLELDINSSQEFDGLIDKAMLPQLLDELVELGKEIASKGDIP